MSRYRVIGDKVSKAKLIERLRESDRRKPITEPSVFSDNSSRPAAEKHRGRVIYISGSTNEFQISDGTRWNTINTGGGSTAPANATFITLTNNATLTAERALTAGTAMSFADGGANSTLTVNHAQVATGDLHQDYLLVDGTRDMTGELGTDVGTFRSDVASGGVGFLFNTSNSFAAGTVFRFTDNATIALESSFEQHLGVAVASETASILKAQRTLSADNRAAFRAANLSAIVEGVIPGAAYSPTLTGALCAMTLQPTSMPITGSRTIRGGDFYGSISGSATQTIANVVGGRFLASDSGGTYGGTVTNAIGGDFTVQSFVTLTNAYGIRTNAISTGTNRWGGNFGNRVAVTSPSADAQEVLNLTQSSTGAAEGVHIKLNDKAGNPPTPVAGDLWRNGNSLYFRQAAATVDLTAAAGAAATDWPVHFANMGA